MRIKRIETEKRIFRFRSALDLLRTLHGIGAAPVRRKSMIKLRHALTEYDHRFSDPSESVRSTWTFVRIEATAV